MTPLQKEIEEKVKEYRKSYEGILQEESISKSEAWYRQALTYIAESARKEAYNECTEHIRKVTDALSLK